MIKFLLLVCFIGSLAGCGPKHEVLVDDEVEQSDLSLVGFESIHKNIIVKKCLSCHNSAQSPHGINLSSYETIINSPVFPPLVYPGDPLGSSLFDSVLSGRMPPQSEPLSFFEKQAVFEWIRLGALSSEVGGDNDTGDSSEPVEPPDDPDPNCEPDEPCD